jgi:hypothetical protein
MVVLLRKCLCLFTWALLVLSPYVVQARSSMPEMAPELLPPSEFSQIGEDLVRAVIAQDHEKLANFLYDVVGEVPLTEIDSGTIDFIYHGENLRHYYSKKAHPIADFIRMGKLHQKTYVMGGSVELGGSVVIVFIPERYLKDSMKKGFYRENLFIKYFMCEFRKFPVGWKMQNFCYEATDFQNYPESD